MEWIIFLEKNAFFEYCVWQVVSAIHNWFFWFLFPRSLLRSGVFSCWHYYCASSCWVSQVTETPWRDRSLIRDRSLTMKYKRNCQASYVSKICRHIFSMFIVDFTYFACQGIASVAGCYRKHDGGSSPPILSEDSPSSAASVNAGKSC